MRKRKEAGRTGGSPWMRIEPTQDLESRSQKFFHECMTLRYQAEDSNDCLTIKGSNWLVGTPQRCSLMALQSRILGTEFSFPAPSSCLEQPLIYWCLSLTFLLLRTCAFPKRSFRLHSSHPIKPSTSEHSFHRQHHHIIFKIHHLRKLASFNQYHQFSSLMRK